MTDRQLSILRLALHEATPEAEWHAAAVMFVRILRKNKTEPEHLKIGSSSAKSGQSGGWTPHPSAHQDGFAEQMERAMRDAHERQERMRAEAYQRQREFERQASARQRASRPASPDPNWQMPFGKYRNAPISQVPTDYLAWMLNNIPDLHPTMKAKVQAEYNSR